MAIQNRRGNYQDFNPSKLLPGEFALSLDDPKLFMGLGGGNNKQIPFLDDADKRYILVNQGTQHTGKILEVDLDGNLKLVPKPTSGGNENILDITFATLGFDSGAGLNKGSNGSVTVSQNIWNEIYSHEGSIRLIFSNEDTIILNKSVELIKKDEYNDWSCHWYSINLNQIKGEPHYIFYGLHFSAFSGKKAQWFRFDMGTGGSGGGSYELPIATAQVLGGIKSSGPTGSGFGKYYNLSVQSDGKAHTFIAYPRQDNAGVVKTREKTLDDTVEISSDENGKLFAPKYPSGGGTGGNYILPVANVNTLGGVKAKTKTSRDTVEVSADETGKLYVPTYPTPSDGGSGGNTYTEGIWEHTANIIFKEETTKTKEITLDKDGNELNIEDVYFIVRNFQAPQNTKLTITLYDTQNTGVKEFSIFKKDKTDETLITLEKFDNTYKMISAVGQYDYFESFADQTGKVYVNDGSSTGIFKKINKIQVSFDKSGSNSAYIYIYKKNKVASTDADTQAIVQEVLKALPTWNGGKY